MRYVLQNRYQDEGWHDSTEYDNRIEAIAAANEDSYDSICCGMVRVIDTHTRKVIIEYPAGSKGQPSFEEPDPAKAEAIKRVVHEAMAPHIARVNEESATVVCDPPKQGMFKPAPNVQVFMGGDFVFTTNKSSLDDLKQFFRDALHELDGWGGNQDLYVHMKDDRISVTLCEGITQ